MDECLQFVGRLRDLCEGRGLNGRIHPPIQHVNNFRARNKLSPINAKQIQAENYAPESPVAKEERVPDASNIGTILAELISQRYHVIPCSGCKNAIVKLNRMKPQEVLEQKQTIVADIASRAGSLKPLWLKLAVWADSMLMTGETHRRIEALLDEACERCTLFSS